jgi:hypothetical protein
MGHRHSVHSSLLYAILFAVLLIMPGCQSVNPLPGFGLVKNSPEETSIREHLKWHSGRVEVYKDFRTIFTARAVYISEEIRRSVVDWEARSRLMSPDEKEEFFRSSYKGGRSAHQVLLGFYTPDRDFNDLDQENSRWIAYLTGPDGAVSRAACHGVDDDEGKMYMRFLEWDLSWSRLYLLCFPVDSLDDFQQDGWMKLVISGPTGQGDIRLRTTPPPR